MSLKLVTGRANTGKTGLAYEAVRRGLDAGRPTVLVMPTEPDAVRARAELAREYPTGPRVARFRELINGLWRQFGDGRRVVTAQQRRLLVARAAHDAGLPISLASTAERLAEQLAASGSAWRSMGAPSGAARELCLVLLGYARRLESTDLIESGEAAALLVSDGTLQGNDIIFHRFSDLTVSEERFLRGAASAGARVLVTLTWDPDAPGTAASSATVQALGDLDEHVHLDTVLDSFTDAELRRFEEGLFLRPSLGPPTGVVTFSSAEGDEAQADRLVADVQRLHRDEGLPYERVAIVFRKVNRHLEPLRRALAEAGIPADIDTVRLARTTPFGRALIALTRSALSADCEALLSALRSGYLTGDAEAVRELEVEWRSSRSRDAVEMFDMLRRLDGDAAQMIRSLRSLEPSTDAAVAAEAWESVVDAMFTTRLGRPGSGPLDASDDSKARASFIRLLADAVLVAETPTLSVILPLLERLTIGGPDVERPGHVQVMDADRVRGRRFDAVLIGGLNAGEFPLANEDPLASAVIGTVFEAASAEPPRWGGVAAERLHFYTLITRARRHLVLCRRLTDSSGSPLGASVFWEEMRDFYREPDPDRGDELVAGLDVCSGIADHGLTDRTSRTAVREEREAAIAVCGCLPGPKTPLPVARAYQRTRRPRSRLSDSATIDRLAQRREFSATELEAYGRCPYLWFVRYLLRADEVDWVPDAREQGIMVHRALQFAYEGLRERGLERMSEEVDARTLAGIVDDSVLRAAESRSLSEPERETLADWARSRVRRSLRADCGFAPGFIPREFEWRFGAEPARLALEADTFVTGTIDRVDLAEDGRAIVIDYKSSSAHALAEFDRQGLVQVPLYVIAVREVLGARPVAGLYRNLATGESRGFALEDEVTGAHLKSTDLVDEQGLELVLERARRRALSAVDGIRSGRIAPSANGSCDYCLSRSWCPELVR